VARSYRKTTIDICGQILQKTHNLYLWPDPTKKPTMDKCGQIHRKPTIDICGQILQKKLQLISVARSYRKPTIYICGQILQKNLQWINVARSTENLQLISVARSQNGLFKAVHFCEYIIFGNAFNFV
jgi:glycerate kinase